MWGAPGTPSGRGTLAVTADQLPTLTGAGEQGLEAGHTVGLLLPKYVLPAEERVLAVVAVKSAVILARMPVTYQEGEEGRFQ